ncbi:hypothetical protein AB835_12595 [Candidatus Endobugula sertula]|uniref:(2E)-enoyl-[ACP] glycyltransferase n=1 Tax=Candidatus Endobugula sertula TaxID=62101 RepID=A0A1D2QME5_9GAMM|nr:hypothetical protein AB835_12595 [Candidatus Endobugula sertula]
MNVLLSEDTQEISDNIIHKILLPYRKKNALYLKKAKMINLEEKENGILSIVGDFEINDSCYVDSTGHFNAVELIICFNQLAYVLFGYAFSHNLFKYFPIKNGTTEAKEILTLMTLDNYLDEQLSAMFILKSEQSFQAVINPNSFQCFLQVVQIFYRNKIFFIKTRSTFSDDGNGKAKSKITLAYVVRR